MSLFKRKPSKPRPQPKRRGLLFAEFEGTGLTNKGATYSPVIEVSEWETLNGLSRITIDRVTGHGGQEHRIRQLIPAWVPTASVKWRTDA